jgi:hypothetical protein
VPLDIQDQHVLFVSIKFILKIYVNKTINIIIVFEDEGCKKGGCLECLNGGMCRSDGYCSCPLGYSGKSCAVCRFLY